MNLFIACDLFSVKFIIIYKVFVAVESKKQDCFFLTSFSQWGLVWLLAVDIWQGYNLKARFPMQFSCFLCLCSIVNFTRVLSSLTKLENSLIKRRTTQSCFLEHLIFEICHNSYLNLKQHVFAGIVDETYWTNVSIKRHHLTEYTTKDFLHLNGIFWLRKCIKI